MPALDRSASQRQKGAFRDRLFVPRKSDVITIGKGREIAKEVVISTFYFRTEPRWKSVSRSPDRELFFFCKAGAKGATEQ